MEAPGKRPIAGLAGKLALGAGYICGIIFNFLPGVLCLYAGYKAFKA